jgi:hypothetical protein
VQDLLGFHYRDLKDTLDWAKSPWQNLSLANDV